MAWKKTEGKTGIPQLPEGVAQVALGSHEGVAQMALGSHESMAQVALGSHEGVAQVALGSCLGPTFSLSLQAITLGNKLLII